MERSNRVTVRFRVRVRVKVRIMVIGGHLKRDGGHVNVVWDYTSPGEQEGQ